MTAEKNDTIYLNHHHQHQYRHPLHLAQSKCLGSQSRTVYVSVLVADKLWVTHIFCVAAQRLTLARGTHYGASQFRY